MELMFAEWEDGERFSFEDSDRFEEDSLCSFISEAESLCQNWRGWRKQSAGPNSPTGGGGGGGSGGTRMRGESELGGGGAAGPAWASLGSCPRPRAPFSQGKSGELSPAGSCPKLRTDFRTRFSGFPGVGWLLHTCVCVCARALCGREILWTESKSFVTPLP